MLKLSIFALLVTFTFALKPKQVDVEWEDFKNRHGREFDTEEERFRKKIFIRNLHQIRLHNEQADNGLRSFRLEMNEFGDYTSEEFQVRNGFRSEMKQSSGRIFKSDVTDLPEIVDWRTKGIVVDVKNQGQCGSCWAFAAVAALEGQHANKTGKLISLSEQNLVDCSTRFGNYGCQGGLPNNAFDYIIDNKGIDTEISYPYTARNGRCRFNRANVGATETSYVDVEEGSEDDLKKASATIGPIAVGIDASHFSFRFYHSGVYDEQMCSTTQIDHGVTVVGYGTENGQDYWLVKNSWGRNWGEKGYIKMSRNNNNQCGIATMASYPVV